MMLPWGVCKGQKGEQQKCLTTMARFKWLAATAPITLGCKNCLFLGTWQRSRKWNSIRTMQCGLVLLLHTLFLNYLKNRDRLSLKVAGPSGENTDVRVSLPGLNPNPALTGSVTLTSQCRRQKLESILLLILLRAHKT